LPAEESFSKLVTLMDELGTLLKALDGSAAGAQSTLRAIYLVNNELGRLARQDGLPRPGLVVVQLHLNLVTTEVKRRRPEFARDAFRNAQGAFRKVREGPDARRAQKDFISRAGLETR